MRLRHHFKWAILSVLISSSAALNILFPPNETPPSDLIKPTNSTLNPQPGHPPNLTYAPWPPQPYEVPVRTLFDRSDLVIFRAREFHGSRPISITSLQAFLRDFRQNLEREYPIPGLVPSVCSQSAYDMQSYTKWTIELSESLVGRRMRTATALVVLEEVGRQLGRHGPASVVFSAKDRGSTLGLGFLGISEFGVGGLNGLLVGGDGSFRTS